MNTTVKIRKQKMKKISQQCMQLLRLLMKYQEPVKVHSQRERKETKAMRKYRGEMCTKTEKQFKEKFRIFKCNFDDVVRIKRLKTPTNPLPHPIQPLKTPTNTTAPSNTSRVAM